MKKEFSEKDLKIRRVDLPKKMMNYFKGYLKQKMP